MLNRVAIIGVGLIGGSLAAALKARRLCSEIVGCGRNLKRLEKAGALGLIDKATTSVADAVADADLVVLGVPVLSMEPLLRRLATDLGDRTVLTDVGSTKRSVLDAARASFGEIPPNFVPGHPIAGREQSGFENASADLFVNHKVILTPHDTIDGGALALTRSLWEGVGAEVVEMSSDHHDQILAATSHLPHVLAYALVEALASMEGEGEIG